jgi:eukaryotic-like serine/threonine-protein kinase
MRSDSTLGADLAADDLRNIDAICNRFEADWRRDQCPDLETYLAGWPALGRPALFRELLRLELEFRSNRGERLAAAAYQRRFPELAGVIDAVFQSHHGARAAVGPHVVGSDGSTVTSPGGHDRPTEASLSDGFALAQPLDASVAGYEILELLGRGGMGVVYRARQTALNRDVALKMILSGSFVTQAEVVRFQNEAEAVAQLDHPHIVPIYEVGRYHGRHFFSMKLIAGSSLDKRLADFAARPRAAARLTAIAALAVHHAHQRGILHRDLKPANILLDDEGQPYVTDFGLAKRIDANGELTHSGVPVGTPSYMSPEQACGTKGALSTATDVYGLGTILYATLAGQAPFAATTLVETLDQVRSASPAPPRSLNPKVPRDLEIICLKCLEKEPARRYSSALALAEDLDRWLNGEPIMARKVRSTTRLWYWCRRHKALASLAALLLIAVLGGFAGVGWQWRRTEHERAKTQAVNQLLTERLLAQASAELDPLARNLTVRDLLDRAGAQLGGWLQDQPDVEAKIRETIGGAYLSLGEYQKAEPHIRTAIELDRKLHGARDPDTLRVTSLLGSLLDQTDRRAEAESLLADNLSHCRASLGALDPITLDAAFRWGVLLWHAGRSDEAESVLRKNVDDRSRVLKPEHPDTLRSMYVLSRVLTELRRFADAERFAYQYAHDIKCANGNNHPDNILALTNRADVERAQGKLTQAEHYHHQAATEAERIFGAGHPASIAAADRYKRFLAETRETRTAPQ